MDTLYICVNNERELKNYLSMFKSKYSINFLFPRTNALIGAGSVFNLAGNYFEFNISETQQAADFFALENDWNTIGRDMLSVISENPQEQFHD